MPEQKCIVKCSCASYLKIVKNTLEALNLDWPMINKDFICTNQDVLLSLSSMD